MVCVTIANGLIILHDYKSVITLVVIPQLKVALY